MCRIMNPRSSARIPAVLALLLAAVLLLPACRKEASPVHGQSSKSSEQTVITDIYRPTRYPLPEGTSLCSEGGMKLDPETGVLTCVVNKELGLEGDYYRYSASILTLSPDGETLGEVPLDTGDGGSVNLAAFAEDRLWYVYYAYRENGADQYLAAADPADGTLITSAMVKKLPKLRSSFSVHHMAVDGDGDVWLVDNGTCAVFTPEMVFVNTVNGGPWFSQLAAAPDGTMWGCSNFAGGWGPAKLDKQTGQWSGSVEVEMSTQQFGFDPDGTLVCGTSGGFCAATKNERGEVATESLMSFVNSGVIYDYQGMIEAEGTETVRLDSVADRDTLLFVARTRENGRLRFAPVVYRRAPDLVLDEEDVIEIAYATELEDNFRAKIIRFNAEHDDARVLTLDYSIYNGDEEGEGNLGDGSWRLTTDIVNGIVNPDVVMGNPYGDLIRTLVKKNMTADLMPYVDADPEYNRDTIFGCVLNAFDNGRGGIWGISPFFFLDTVYAPTERLREYGLDENWTLGDYLDLCDNLPEGQWASFDMKRGQDPIGDWECFLDMQSWEAHFDDPLFIRYLNFLASLPGEADYQKTEAGSCSFYDRRKLMADGTVLLSSTAFSNDVPILERNFNTADVSFIGYPSADASFFTFSAFVILNASENPDASWQLIRTMFEIDEMTGWYGTLPGKSVLKTTFEENMDELRNDRILYRFEGGEYYAQTKDAGEDTKKLMDMMIATNPYISAGEPYEIVPLNEELVGKVKTYLDTAGVPMIYLPPAEITEIVLEEQSAFLGGVGTAADCAAKIQSRVNLWLAENQRTAD